MDFDYFYGERAKDFQFFQIPKVLFNKNFDSLNNDARILYALLLDRTALSCENGWIDEYNRTFVIFSSEDICDLLLLSRPTARKARTALEAAGLIQRVRRGQGEVDIIYVKNFTLPIKSFANDCESSDGKNLSIKKANTFSFGSKHVFPLEEKKTPVNNNNNNKTDLNKTDSINQSNDGQIDNIKIKKSVEIELLEEKHIPYYYTQDESRMTAAVRILTNWSEDYYLYDGIEDDSPQDQQAAQQRQAMLDTLNDCLVDMMCSSKPMYFLGAMVTYSKVIDVVNSLINTDKSGKIISLFDFTDSCVNHLVSIVNTRKVEATIPYLKSSIWTYLKSYKVTGNINYTALKMAQE